MLDWAQGFIFCLNRSNGDHFDVVCKSKEQIFTAMNNPENFPFMMVSYATNPADIRVTTEELDLLAKDWNCEYFQYTEPAMVEEIVNAMTDLIIVTVELPNLDPDAKQVSKCEIQ